MTDQDYNDLETLLGKLGSHINRKFAIIPTFVHDGPQLATYDERGIREDEVIAIDLKTAVEIIINRQKRP